MTGKGEGDGKVSENESGKKYRHSERVSPNFPHWVIVRVSYSGSVLYPMLSCHPELDSGSVLKGEIPNRYISG